MKDWASRNWLLLTLLGIIAVFLFFPSVPTALKSKMTSKAESSHGDTNLVELARYDSESSFGWLASERDLAVENVELVYVYYNEKNRLKEKSYVTCIVYVTRKGTPRRYFDLSKEYQPGYYRLEGGKLIEQDFSSPPNGYSR